MIRKTLIVNDPIDVEVLVDENVAIEVLNQPYLAVYLPLGVNIRQTPTELILGRLEALDEAEVVE